MTIHPHIFRSYDIRGIVDEDLTPESVETIGKAFGSLLRERGKTSAFVGRDARLSSPSFRDALIAGLLSTGLKVVDLGMVPTPVFYFAVYTQKAGGGVMITGSHNPSNYNGFKLMVGEETLFGEQIQEVYKIIQKGRFHRHEGGELASLNIVPSYWEYMKRDIRFTGKPKIVIDAGNGVGGVVAAPLFRSLGAEVVELFTEPDGRFPNHHPDPTVPENMEALAKAVLENRADFGIGYDGDADRIGVVDDKGRLLFGDQILYILIQQVLADVPGGEIIADVKASNVLFSEVARLKGKPLMWMTGHSLIKNKMKEDGAILAGEMSGHIFFKHRYFGFDDAIYSSLRFTETVTAQGRPVSAWLDSMPKVFNTPEIRRESTEEKKFAIVDALRKRWEGLYPISSVDGVRVTFPDGWGLVRASNTQPVLVLRFEASSPESLERIQGEMNRELASIEADLK